MTAVLHGAWGAHAQILRGVSPAQLLLVNPPDGHRERRRNLDRARRDVRRSRMGRRMRSRWTRPLTRRWLRRCSRACGQAGGCSGPLRVAVPASLTELARDDDVWVAQLRIVGGDECADPSDAAPARRSRR